MRQRAIAKILDLAVLDERVVFIGSDLGPGVLDGMKKRFPDRFFMEGVSEANIIGMAAGMAMDGYIPYINTIATFLTRRCLDQIVVDLCLENLPVRLIASGGGLVYAPLGPTHIAFDDIGLLRTIPNMTVAAPCDAPEMERLMDCTLDWPGPLYIRVAKGGDPVISDPAVPFALGRAITMREGGPVLIVATGVMTARALAAAERLAARQIECAVLHMHTIKPLDEAAILRHLSAAGLVVTIEEHSAIGGLGSAVADLLVTRVDRPRYLRLALEDRFPTGYGSQDHLLTLAGLDIDSIVRRIAEAAP